MACSSGAYFRFVVTVGVVDGTTASRSARREGTWRGGFPLLRFPHGIVRKRGCEACQSGRERQVNTVADDLEIPGPRHASKTSDAGRKCGITDIQDHQAILKFRNKGDRPSDLNIGYKTADSIISNPPLKHRIR